MAFIQNGKKPKAYVLLEFRKWAGCGKFPYKIKTDYFGVLIKIRVDFSGLDATDIEPFSKNHIFRLRDSGTPKRILPMKKQNRIFEIIILSLCYEWMCVKVKMRHGLVDQFN